MKKTFNYLTIAFAAMMIFVSCKQQEMNKLPANVIPKPVSLEERGGFFEIKPSTKILIPENQPDVEMIATSFALTFNNVSGIELNIESIADRRNDQGIIFEILPESDSLGDEGYLLYVKNKKIELSARTPAGLYRGLQTLYQLMPVAIFGNEEVENVEWKIPRVNIYDKPRYAWRGMHLDVSRHFFPKEFILRYIDLIAMHKMNVFHWHLTDDNGWRIQIDKYPKLTEIAAWRVDREHQPWNEVTPPEPGENATYGGFYTKDDVREVVQYAAERHITIVPEIEMPGHSSEVLAAYPELSCTGGTFYVQPGSYWPNVDILCAGNEKTFEFIEGVLDEVIELFPGQYLHIGGDEATKTRWENCPKCQKRIKNESLKNEHELQSYFIKRVEKYLISKGKRLIGWDEILEGGLAPEATVMSWRGFEGGIEAARQGHDVVMSPGSHCYFDHYQANPDFEPKAIGGFTTLKKVYSFDPTPQELTEAEAKHILGGQANLWTEFVKTPEHAEYMAVPRMSALAEVLWSPKTSLNWEDFYSRLQTQLDRFDVMGVNYSEGSFAVNFITEFDEANQQFVVSFETEHPNSDIRYTLDGTEPSANSAKYEKPVIIGQSTTIKAGIFTSGIINETFSEKTIVFHKAIGAQVKYENQPESRYLGQGDKNLVDGLKGTLNIRDGFWQGFNGKNLDVVIDLGMEKEINSVTATFLQNYRDWIFLPTELEVCLSSDGNNFSTPVVTKNDVPADTKGGFIHALKTDFAQQKARFVKLTAKSIITCPPWHSGAGDKAWLFVDEVVVE